MKASWKRFGVSAALAVFFLLAGFGLRYTEDSQVGYTHDTSLWTFGLSGLCAYYSLLMLFLLLRRPRHRSPMTNDH